MKKGNLTLIKMEKLYAQAERSKGCDVCNRKIRYVYFYENQIMGATCGYHQIREKKNEKI